MKKWIGGLIAVVLGLSLTFSIAAQEFKLPQGKSGDDFVNEAKNYVSGVSVGDAKRLFDSDSDVKFIDVRPIVDRGESGYLPGDVSMPAGRLIFNITLRIVNKDRPLIVYCKKGKRSAVAAWQLKQMGYTNVRYLDGGITAWKNAGYPVTTGSKYDVTVSMPTGKSPEDFVREAKAKAKGISPEEANRIRNSDSSVVTLDIMTAPEHALVGALENSLKMEAGMVPFNIKKKVHNALTPIIVVCKSGKRSVLLTAQLGEMGYEKASYIIGGTEGWKKAGFPVEK